MSPNPQRQLLILKARMLKALAQPIRLALVDCLQDGERCVCNLAEIVGAERSNVSRHLAVLVNAGVLTCRKKGVMTLYRLKTPCLLKVFGCLDAALKAELHERKEMLQAM